MTIFPVKHVRGVVSECSVCWDAEHGSSCKVARDADAQAPAEPGPLTSVSDLLGVCARVEVQDAVEQHVCGFRKDQMAVLIFSSLANL